MNAISQWWKDINRPSVSKPRVIDSRYNTTSWQEARREKERAIYKFVNETFNDIMDVRNVYISYKDDFLYTTLSYNKNGLEGEDTYKVFFSPCSLEEAAMDFAARHRLIAWGWKDIKYRNIIGFDADAKPCEFLLDNWHKYIEVFSFENIETGEIIVNKPKATAERDIKGFITNLVRTNHAFFTLVAEKVANDGPYTFDSILLSKDKPFTEFELNLVIKEIKEYGLETVDVNYGTGMLTLDFLSDDK